MRKSFRIMVFSCILYSFFTFSVFALQEKQGGPVILKDKVTDLVEQVKQRDERLALRRATIAKQRLMLVSFVLFAALAISVLTVVRNRERARRRELKYELNRTKQQALSFQMNPHFIFNTLGSLQTYILKNDRDSSNLYLTKFSRLMRLTLENMEKEYVDLEAEVTALRLYLELQQMRFRDSFDYRMTIDPKIVMDSLCIPPFLVQPYVENAIHHGLLHRDTCGHLTVEIEARKGGVIWIIEDDGIGREAAAKIKIQRGEDSRLHSTDITHRRIELLNAFTPGQYAVTVIDLKDDGGDPRGTRVELFMTGVVP